MSRGFWATVGAIVGFFVGGSVGQAIGRAHAHTLALGPGGVAEAAGDFAAIGSVIGIPAGFVIAWFLARRRQRRR